jgi:PAS domain S-box-containing protein
LSLTTPESPSTGRKLALIGTVVAIAAIALLVFNVSREIKLLSSANSDNVQWALSQTEVEFLDLSILLDDTEPQLSDIRRRFDVFYSRIDTVQKASVFADLRTNATFKNQLVIIQEFLDVNLSLVDGTDANLIAQIPELNEFAKIIRPEVRRLANSGLKQFAINSDQQRQAVARTMIELAIALATLIGALAFFVYYLKRLNEQTEKREREQKQTAMRMNTVIATSLDGVIVSNADGKIIEFSPAAEAIFGHRFEEVAGKGIGEVIVPESLRDAHNAGMERMRNGSEKRVVGKGRVTLEAMRANGELFPVELAIQSAMTNDGEVFVAFLRDISKRVADEAELVETRDKALAGEKMKTDFLATMSHEIRTPLNGLLGNMDLLRDTKLSRTQNRYVRDMETSGRLLMSQISDVLDITRYDAGKLSTRSQPLDVSALMQDIIDSQSGMAAANDTTLDWGWDGKPQNWINSDLDRLQHILMNLIGNAVKFTKRGKVSLTVGLSQEAGNQIITFEVKDSGQGISSELAERVFDDFVTGNTAYDRDVGGTGLGLSIAKRFVTALDGEIWLESVEGEGSSFFVTLPVTLAEASEEIDARMDSAKSDLKFDVLLIEDNEINRIVAREMLEADGHTVTEAHDGLQGVHTAQSKNFDLILMDISMPVMDGRTATRTIRSGQGASADTKIVALTANAMEEERKSFKEDGMNGILTKPLTKAALRKVLNVIGQETSPGSDMYIDQDHNTQARDALGDDAYSTLLERFSSETEELISWLQSDANLTQQEIVDRVHKVAGSAAVFGATQFRNHLLKIENAAKLNQDEEIRSLLDQFPSIWHSTNSVLN